MSIWIEQPGKTGYYCGLRSGEVNGFTNIYSLRTEFGTRAEADQCLEEIKERHGAQEASVVELFEKQRSFQLLRPGTIVVELPRTYDPLFVSFYDENTETPVIEFSHDPDEAKMFNVNAEFVENDFFDIQTLVNNKFSTQNPNSEGLLFPVLELI